MEEVHTERLPLREAWFAHVQQHPFAALGLTIAAVVVLALVASSVYNAFAGGADPRLRYGLLGGMAGLAATALGAFVGLGLRNISKLTEDSMLGFAAGMMLAASAFSLILPGLDAARNITDSAPLAALTVALGLALGAILMLGLDRFTPHAHEASGVCGPAAERINRVWLFVFAIVLHNLPEGMAIGVSFAQGDLSVGMPLTTAIAIQDIPEGLAVGFALRAAGVTALRAALIAAASGVMEPLGAILGIGLSSGFAIAYPVGLGLAAGAMIFVVSHEVIPETHRNGHETPATLGLMAGFGVMMFLDTAFA
ncbi:MAG: ZIP family metal transporter [Betaproteobacteria bacterium]|nr:ZIP family metal transporter [Betaproteobacteria bacterium]